MANNNSAAKLKGVLTQGGQRISESDEQGVE